MSGDDERLGRVSSVDVRHIWPHEERDFTPWLLEHSKVLEQALGIDIELHHREERIGDFSLDIIGRDLSSDAPLIIENQLEPSDHRHLGQLLTYASGSDAGTIVWIARSFSEPHRSALDWLNAHTSDGIRFFGIEIRAIRVDDSRPAPVLEVVARPNDWERRVASSTKPLSPKMELYREFWDRYLAIARAKGWTTARTPQAQSWIAQPSGLSGVLISAAFTRQGLASEIYFDVGDADRNLNRFERLQEQREAFEAAYGRTLEWQDLPEKKACRVVEYLPDVAIEDHQDWTDHLEWLTDRHARLRSALLELGGVNRAVGEA
jgi:hypothetical protein